MKTLGLGANYLGQGRCRFCVWAPLVQNVKLRLLSPRECIVSLQRSDRGYHHAIVEGVEPGILYLYRLEGEKERPDPASRSQPQGVHGPSEVIDPMFPWEDHSWFGFPLRKYILYELHVGTFTQEGTFEAVIPYLNGLRELGITAVELMPVAQFPGSRNWGYDGVYLFAPQNAYGGPEGLKRLVNACHREGLAVVLDVVYNHLGPEGNVLWDFGPYFTERYKTPWGAAVNFDGPLSDEVRRFFIESALYWVTEFHMDALRIDAVHAILDFSARPFLEDLTLAVHEQAERLNRQVYLIPESALNDTRLIRSRELGGFGMDAQWNDDFHHALHTLLTGERTGYYQDFGRLQDMVKAYREGYVYSGEYSPYRRRRHGNSSRDIPASRFVVFSQNHDHVGNRMLGERLSDLVSFEGLKLAAGVVVLSPFIPLLFMGEEFGEKAPFPYFVSHTDPDLVEAVRKGRKEEFAAFQWQNEPPDPQAEATFLSAKVNHQLRGQGHHRALYELYREIIRLRKEIPALARLSKKDMEVIGFEKQNTLFVKRLSQMSEVVVVFHLGEEPISVVIPLPKGRWEKRVDSAEKRWHGPGSEVPAAVDSEGEVRLRIQPHSFVLFSLLREGIRRCDRDDVTEK